MKKTLIFTFFVLFGVSLFAQNKNIDKDTKKMLRLMYMINNYYVDTTNMPKLTESAIEGMLKELDPHSTYIPKKEVQKMNEPLQGNIIGIGVTFQLLNDTIHVMDVVADGPAEKVGMFPGDKIVKVNDSAATGDSIDNEWVMSRLRGKKGSMVKVEVARIGKDNIVFDIKRDNIPLNSIDTWFMIDKEVGYIALRRFAQKSDEELQNAIKDLKSQGMKKLIFDLRSNGGGYLETAFKICEEFLSEEKMVVYTEGEKQPRQEWKTTSRKGEFEKGNLVILTDEYTASASEITSGAVQDWDRGVIVGRRTFGKGLVQRPFNLDDGSQVRLTIARYYIPSGRCIQKPYDNGVDDYRQDYQKRYSHGEMIYADSISFPDSLKYHTNNNRVVYGGGGIMPDIFVPMDTTRASDYYINLRSKNLFNEYSINYAEANREELLKKYPTYDDFDKAWNDLNLMQEFQHYADEKGVKPDAIKTDWVNNMVRDYLKENTKDSTKTYNSYVDYAKEILKGDKMLKEILSKAEQEDIKQQEYIRQSNSYIESNLKGFIARNLYGTKYYYKAVQQNDETLQTALKIIKDDKQYNKILKSKKK
ncbi:MAG: S41 family peptidase [Bacteroidales bacterium]|nr:S41 family peptidase [Bacteroidales bacterium]